MVDVQLLVVVTIVTPGSAPRGEGADVGLGPGVVGVVQGLGWNPGAVQVERVEGVPVQLQLGLARVTETPGGTHLGPRPVSLGLPAAPIVLVAELDEVGHPCVRKGLDLVVLVPAPVGRLVVGVAAPYTRLAVPRQVVVVRVGALASLQSVPSVCT